MAGSGTAQNGTQDPVENIINTDGRKPYEWESKYPEKARTEMRVEAIYIAIVLLISLVGLYLNWSGELSGFLCLDEAERLTFEGIAFYYFSGLLGGTVFGVKYFYRVVARGFWTQDRRYWRVFSPWISSCVSLIVGCMVVVGYINAGHTPSNATGICIGFVAGYFADEAVGKMSEVATALFGNGNKAK